VHRQVRFGAGLGTAVVLLLVAGLSLTSRRGLLGVKATYDRAIDDERSARRALEDILAAVSHDLRSPLSVIVINNALTLKNAPPGEPGNVVRRRAGVVQRAAERMDRLIQDLLSASRIEAGRLSLDLGAHDVRGVMSDAEELFAPIAAQRSIHLSSEVPSAPCVLRCDRDRLLQVVSNLVDNALKFTPEGGTVTLSLRCLDEGVSLSVADTGPGIHTEQLPHIFEKHWSGRGKARADAGLGLYIVKGIVAAHGGTIQVDTKPGAGTTFSISLPCATAQPSEPR
jgi:signal transduction histidine kinase